MYEVIGNLWDVPAEVVCITTNGFVKNNGEAVMGRGCAYEAKTRDPELPKVLGSLLRDKGNHVHHLPSLAVGFDTVLLSFPVKHVWNQAADLDLIVRSCNELMAYLDGHPRHNWPVRALLPRPGCGNGQLSWEQVRPVCAELLDNRVGVITNV